MSKTYTRWIYFLFFVFIASFFSFQTKNEIKWSPIHQLEWNDFKAKTPNTGFDALTYYNVRFNTPIFKAITQAYSYKILCYFNPNRSWVKKEKKTLDLLKHEQNHFDLAQIYASKLQIALNKAKIGRKKAEEKSKKIFNEIMKDLQKEQLKYDEATDHSKNKKAQKEWNEKIHKQVIKLLTRQE